MSESYEGRQIVGMDLHRRRSVLVRMSEAGERLETVRISNDPEYLRAVMARAGEHPDVVLEATYGWEWLAELLEAEGARAALGASAADQGDRVGAREDRRGRCAHAGAAAARRPAAGGLHRLT